MILLLCNISFLKTLLYYSETGLSGSERKRASAFRATETFIVCGFDPTLEKIIHF